MKKILLTGGIGYIGSHICVELLDKGYEVFVIDNLSNSSKKVLNQIELITRKKITFFEIDIREKHKLLKILKSIHSIV